MATAAGSAEASASSLSPAHLALAGFKLTRVLSQDAKTRSAALLGTLPKRPPSEGSSNREGQEEEREDAIVLLEKTHFEESFYEGLGVVEEEAVGERGAGREDDEEDGGRSSKRAKLDSDETSATPQPSIASTTTTVRLRNLSDVQSLGQNDIYTWLLARHSTTSSAPPDIKLTLIRPASKSHIEKHSVQEKVMIYETPQMYREKTLPWIEGQDKARIQWVYNILEGRKETESVVYRDPHPTLGLVVSRREANRQRACMLAGWHRADHPTTTSYSLSSDAQILPDLKWDRKTLSSLYLQAIVQDRSLRSLRDLTRAHIPLLRKIRIIAARVVAEEYGLGSSHLDNGREKIRCFIHYHPSYYHLHVHVLSADYTSHAGAIVGQAHLLDDIIDLLELGIDMKSRTIGCALGSRHELLGILRGGGGGAEEGAREGARGGTAAAVGEAGGE